MNIDFIKDSLRNKGYSFVKTERIKGKNFVFYLCDVHPDLGEQRVRHDALLINNYACDNCKSYNTSKKRTHEEYISLMDEKWGNEYLVTSEYKKALKNVTIMHRTCGHKYEITAEKALNGPGCPLCSHKSKKWTPKLFRQKVIELGCGNYEPLTEYKKASEKIQMLHKECGTKYPVTPNKFLSGRRCPNCKRNSSELASTIEMFLSKNYLYFDKEYFFEYCRNILPLPFDFAVFKDNSLIALIEADGEHHYEGKNYYGSSDSYERTKKNDEIKNEFCKRRSIPLLRISYLDKPDCLTILKEFLSDFYLFELDSSFDDKLFNQILNLVPINLEKATEIRRTYLESSSASAEKIASTYSVSKQTILSILNYKVYPFSDSLIKEQILHKLSSNSRRSNYSQEQIEEMISLSADQKWSFRKIAKKFNTNHGTISRLINGQITEVRNVHQNL